MTDDDKNSGGWRPMSDTPEAGVLVLVGNAENGDVEVGLWEYCDYKGCMQWFTHFDFDGDDVTHWMPIPELPEAV